MTELFQLSQLSGCKLLKNSNAFNKTGTHNFKASKLNAPKLITTTSSCLSLFLVLGLIGCRSESTETVEAAAIETQTNAKEIISSVNTNTANEVQTIIESSDTTNLAKDTTRATYTVKPTSEPPLIQRSQRIQRALAHKDYASITDDIHPTKGVRFSMYAFVSLDIDKVFTRAQYAQYLKASKIKFTWGSLDGTGEMLIVSLPEFLEGHLQASRFNNTTPLSTNFESRGNTPSNIDKVYPNAEVVEFYVDGQEKYAGMDWRALRLVFEDYKGKSYLVGIVSDQWTT